jgi:hypothetical protein
MNARTELFATYAEWRRWTDLEGQAIQAANWGRVQECQCAKQRLQPRIIRGTERARQECARLGLPCADLEREVRGVVGELIQLETHNGQVVALQRQTAEAERAELDRSSHNLRRVHQSYGGPRAPGWTSFS